MMTVKELHTFTDADIETIVDALKIANAHYRMMAEQNNRYLNFRGMFEEQAAAAGALQLKIEAAL